MNTNFDLTAIKQANPIREVVERDGIVLHRSGRAYVGLCPFHTHTKHTPSFAVYPDNNTWHCYGQCAEGGDVIKYVMKRDRLSFVDVCKKLGGQTTTTVSAPAAPPPLVVDVPPNLQWQTAAWDLVMQAKHCLWSEAGSKAREYLREQRLLTDYTIDRWQLGFIPTDSHVKRESWGLEPLDDGKGLWIPRGIVIPTYDSYNNLWALHVRRAQGDPKYPHIAGSKKSLWGTQNIDRRLVMMWGGEFDAMLAEQEAAHCGGNCSPTTGEGSQWSSTWSGHMLYADVVLCCYDSDEAGQRGAWRNIMAATGRAAIAPTLPLGVKDLTDYARAGGNVRQWILNLRSEFLTKHDDPAQLWKRLEANYESRDEHVEYYTDLKIDFEMSES